MIRLLACVMDAVRTRGWNLRARMRLSGAGARFGKSPRCQGLVIGAGSVVVRDIPANVVAAGNPAKAIRQLSVPGTETGRA